MKLEIVPIDFAEANQFVKSHHRHHGKVVGHKFSIGLSDGEKIVGVSIVGRPVARMLQDGWTLEVNRLCTDGTKNACSMLYAASWRCARDMGYKKLITYILDSESGTSLTASGWTLVGEAGGGSWNSKSRPRVDKHPTQGKLKYEVCVKNSTVSPAQKIATGNSEPLNGGYTSAPLESVNWKEEQEKRTEIYGKTLQDKLGELPVERQEKIKKLTDKKIAEGKLSKIESIDRMAEEADRAGLYDKVLVPDSAISVQDLGKESPFVYTPAIGCGSPSEGPGGKVAINRRQIPIQDLDSVSADLPTLSEPKNLSYEPFED